MQHLSFGNFTRCKSPTATLHMDIVAHPIFVMLVLRRACSIQFDNTEDIANGTPRRVTGTCCLCRHCDVSEWIER
eukprot:m.63032 g.63032  ORF g.63032 m.63032 type:complete len:75 (+) comp11938_c0_seq1:80-304(+)